MATGVAPTSVRPDALVLVDGDNAVDVPDGSEALFRVETSPDEHTAFEYAHKLDRIDAWLAEHEPNRAASAATASR